MKYLFLGTVATLFFLSCGQGDAANSAAKTPEPVAASQDNSYTPPAGVSATISTSLKPVFDSYLQLKNALAADNSKEASKAGQAMTAALAAVDTSAMSKTQQASYNALRDDLLEHAEHITDNSDKIEHQRHHFKMMSDDVYDLTKTFGGGRKLYYAHCPMAFDGKGASWISEVAEIKNPYYGDQMLECGEVKEELK